MSSKAVSGLKPGEVFVEFNPLPKGNGNYVRRLAVAIHFELLDLLLNLAVTFR